MLHDAPQRLLATDPTQSFIVQAPAGSGKTELLTQRFLKLLAVVEEPEHIVALTFTRKAASEMKERILGALRYAEDALPTDTRSPHQQQTYDYAKAALINNQTRHWNLLKHSHRLRIMTIDALCQRFSTAIPLFEKEIPFANITDSPEALYEQAARMCIHDAITEPSLQSAIRILLTHLDNRQDRLIQLFCDQLTCRDQWLEVILTARALTRSDFEAALKQIEEHTLARLLQSIPFNHHDELQTLCQQMAIIENNPENPRNALVEWTHFNALNRPIANGLAHLLLTQDNRLRRGFDHHVGLKKDRCDDYTTIKARSQALCTALSALPDFEQLLGQVKALPSPTYTEYQWEVLQALFILLPVLVAELHLIFQQSNAVDFTAITQQALHALGDEDSPSDLTLYLDHLIHHLLIDEFQDTSISQVRLINQLVSAWEPGDGKTLFVVGDPMQSIYRFRQAEVGLFLKVRQEGIGGLHLTSLELSSNFRSTSNVIDWINTHFKIIFPYQEDIESGAVSFFPSTAVRPATSDSLIEAYQFTDKVDEAQGMVALIQEQLKQYPDDNIAILVRSRAQLSEIIQALREAQIGFQGVEINALSHLAHLRDMWSLTKALLYPADRLSWIALLRSPYGGLPLRDLHILANIERKKSIYFALGQLHTNPNAIGDELSEEGQIRLRFIHQVMTHALATRHQRPLVDWILTTAQQLHGASLITAHQGLELEQFWQLLERHFNQTTFPDLVRLEQEFDRLYSKQSTPAKVQIMTIHKSKGLEFDCVILPGLGGKSKPPDNPLIRWLKLPHQHDQDTLLISPIKAASENESPLYQYLNNIESEKAQYELQRLFYVAATRAKKRLYLLDHQHRDNKGSFRNLLKHQDWISPKVQDTTTPNTLHSKPDEVTLEEESTQYTPLPLLTRLPRSFYIKPFEEPLQILNHVPVITPSNTLRQIGIITHELLQWICTYHPSTVEHLPWMLVENRCKQFGFDSEQRQAIQAQLEQQMDRFFSDPLGQWIAKRHENEQNEYPLLTQENEHTRTRVIDRTFIENNIRWIIDFKTGDDDAKKQAQHQQQVNYYAELMRHSSPYPIHGGIYYLATNHWVTWTHEVAVF